MFHDESLDIIGIQEGRLQSAVKSGVHYEMYFGQPSKCGAHGCQVWIARDRKPKLLCAISHSARLLTVHALLSENNTEVFAVAAHAPTEGAESAVKDAFWDMLVKVILSARASVPHANIILMIDANSRVGSVVSSGIGAFQPELENENGSRFRAFLETCHMWAINTFVAAGQTWRSTYGTWHRLDYICLQMGTNAVLARTTTDSNIDLSTTARVDHLALVSSIVAAPVPKKQTKMTPKFKVNPLHLQESARILKFRDLLADHQLSLHGDIDDMLQARVEHIKKSAKIAFG